MITLSGARLADDFVICERQETRGNRGRKLKSAAHCGRSPHPTPRSEVLPFKKEIKWAEADRGTGPAAPHRT